MNSMRKVRAGKVAVILLLLVFVFGNTNARAEKLRNLPEITKAPQIFVWKDRIYIMDGNTCKIHIYSTSTLQYLSSFGGKGAGPGEFISTPEAPIAHGEALYVHGNFRVSLFSKEGRLIKIIKTPIGFSRLIPIGTNFLGQKLNLKIKTGKNGRFFSTVSLYDSTFKKIKKLIDKFPSNSGMADPSKKRDTLYHFEDCLKFDVSGNFIVLGDTGKGFYFQILSQSGKIVREINLPYKEQKITPEIKQMAVTRFEEAIDYMCGDRAERIKKNTDHEFPQKMPAFKNFIVSNNKIYVFPHCFEDEGLKVIVISLDGKVLKKSVVTGLNYKMIEIFPMCIEDDTVYYVIDNVEEEEWELHKEKLK